MDLPVRRFRQVVAVISERRFLEARERRLNVEWQTRELARYFAATSGSKGLLESANEIGRRAHKKDPTEPRVGSYERIMQGFTPRRG